VLPGEEVPQQDENLKAVAEKGETKTMEQATSADGNAVPVQSTNVPEANQRALKDQAYTQIQELSNANAELLTQNRGLQFQNSNLNSDEPAQASQLAQNRAQIAQNKATMLANGEKAIKLDTQYKVYSTAVVSDTNGTEINLK
jgi:allophanate hydrolase subunit 1